jgi:hypothetical protein
MTSIQFNEEIETYGYTMKTPDGVVQFRAYTKSNTVHRLLGLCECNALPEFIKVYQKGEHYCHQAAFEFAYSLIASLSLAGIIISRKQVGMWRWCIANRKLPGLEDTLHSWIEHDLDDEAFDIARIADEHNPATVYVYVRPRPYFRAQHRVEDVESRSFYDVGQWLTAKHNSPLFTRYADIANGFVGVKSVLIHHQETHR